MKRLLIIAMAVAALSCCAMAAPTADPDSALYASLRRLEARADSGDAKARFNLAELLERGYGPVAPDSARALALYAQAADDGYAPAMNYLGFKLFNGDGVERDRDRGYELIERAAMKGDPKGAANLGWMLAAGQEVVPDPEKAVYWLERAADAGLPVAMDQLASIYTHGLPPVNPDTLRAATLLERAAEAGYRGADMRLLALMRHRWAALPPDSAVTLGVRLFTSGEAPLCAVALFRQAAAEGSARAWALLGEANALGHGTPYDNAKAIEAFYRAASMGYAPAQYILAELLDIFPDALTDILDSGENAAQLADVNAASWYEKAAAGGITDARQALDAILGPAGADAARRGL